MLALLSGTSAAQAGEWKIAGVQSMASGSNIVSYTDGADGKGIILKDHEGPGPDASHPDNSRNDEWPLWETDLMYFDKDGGDTIHWQFGLSVGATKVSATAEINGRARAILQWQRNKIWVNDVEVDDPNDNPPATVILRTEAYAEVSAHSNNNSSNYSNNDQLPGTEHVSASVPGGEDVPIPGQVNGKMKYVKSKPILIQLATNGQDRVEGKWCQLNAKGSIDGDRVLESPEGEIELSGDTSAVAHYRATLDNRHVWITSPTIETSYYKGAGPVAPGDPPGRIDHKRNPDGSIATSSAAEWDDCASEWFGYGVFEAQTPNWTAPIFDWSLQGGSMVNPNYPLSPNHKILELYRGGTSGQSSCASSKISLGGTQDGTGMTRASTLTVTATDTGDDAQGKNVFGISWHFPIENIQEYGTPTSSYSCVPAAVVNGYPQSTNSPDTEIKVVVNPSIWNCRLLLSDSEQTISGALQFALGTIGGGAKHLITGQPFKSAVRLWLVLKYFGKVSWSESSPGPGTQSVFNTEPEWNKAITSTQASLAGDSSADARVTPSEIASGDTGITRWLGSDMTVWIKRPFKVRFYHCDEYNTNGYKSQANGQFEDPGQPEAVGYYNYTGAPPTP